VFFELSKLLWFLVEPANLLLIALVLGSLLLWTGWRRFGRLLLSLTAILAVIVSIVPAGDWLLRLLENRFPTVRSLPDRIDGVIVLGGAVDQFVTASRGQVALNDAVERLTEAAAIVKSHPDAKYLYTAGSGDILRQNLKEADAAAPFLDFLGIEAGRILIEDQSRNTYENAAFSFQMVHPKQGETWILVTSAAHMPRAVGCFRAVGWNVIPYPVDYGFTENQPVQWSFSLSKGLGRLGVGIREWLGLLFYRLTGRTDAFFPGPEGV
jgi:uncharacterized SAM-binding protein YcdF (DUF218 family)